MEYNDDDLELATGLYLHIRKWLPENGPSTRTQLLFSKNEYDETLCEIATAIRLYVQKETHTMNNEKDNLCMFVRQLCVRNNTRQLKQKALNYLERIGYWPRITREQPTESHTDEQA